MTFVRTLVNVPDIMFCKCTKIRATKYHTLTDLKKLQSICRCYHVKIIKVS